MEGMTVPLKSLGRQNRRLEKSDLMLKSAIEHPAWEIRYDERLGVDGGL